MDEIELHVCSYCDVEGDGEEWYFASNFSIETDFKLCPDCAFEAANEMYEGEC